MNKSYFEQVYEKTHRSLIRYAIVHLDDPTDAEDALQNVYVDFYRRVERYGHFVKVRRFSAAVPAVSGPVCARHSAERLRHGDGHADHLRRHPVLVHRRARRDGRVDPFGARSLRVCAAGQFPVLGHDRKQHQFCL